MSRTTKVVGFSVPPEIYKRLEKLIKVKHQTRSEFIREMFDVYLQTLEEKSDKKEAIEKLDLRDSDFSNILKAFWRLKARSDIKIITIGLAVIVNQQNKVLIAARRGKDRYVENLTWVFPGGNLDSLDFDREVQKEVQQEANLEIKVNSLIAARVHPDSTYKDVQIVALYFHCTPVDSKSPKAGGEIKELKWVEPLDVFKYFTTSTCDDVTKFLTAIQKSS